eukprot:6200372-Pleurochrysis_carterae.AAC.1
MLLSAGHEQHHWPSALTASHILTSPPHRAPACHLHVHTLESKPNARTRRTLFHFSYTGTSPCPMHACSALFHTSAPPSPTAPQPALLSAAAATSNLFRLSVDFFRIDYSELVLIFVLRETALKMISKTVAKYSKAIGHDLEFSFVF